MEHRKYLELIKDNCLRCRHCRCYHAVSMIGEVCYGELATLLLEDSVLDLNDSIFGCHQCGLCLKNCPKHFNAKEFMYHARGYLENKNRNLCHCYQKVRVDQKDNLFTKLKKENNIQYNDTLKTNTKCHRLFIPGCHMNTSFPELTHQVTHYLIDKDMIDGMSEICCGNPLYASGHYQEYQDYIKKLDKLYQENEVQSVITPCPSCYDFYLRMQEEGHFQNIEVLCLSDELYKHNIKIKNMDCPISIHDSCPDRSRGIFANSIRKLYQDYDVIELEHHKENTICCGSGGLVPMYSSHISTSGKNIKLQDYEKANTNYVVTTCFNCYKGLKDILPIHHYLQDLMEDE